jgi:hypothetical protein
MCRNSSTDGEEQSSFTMRGRDPHSRGVYIHLRVFSYNYTGRDMYSTDPKLFACASGIATLRDMPIYSYIAHGADLGMQGISEVSRGARSLLTHNYLSFNFQSFNTRSDTACRGQHSRSAKRSHPFVTLHRSHRQSPPTLGNYTTSAQPIVRVPAAHSDLVSSSRRRVLRPRSCSCEEGWQGVGRALLYATAYRNRYLSVGI